MKARCLIVSATCLLLLGSALSEQGASADNNLWGNWVAVSVAEVGNQQPKEGLDQVKLTRSEEAEHAIRLLGQPFFRVFVYQWQGGRPEGWVQFDGPTAERKLLLSEQTIKALLEDAKEATPSAQSGMLVITIGMPDESKKGLCPCQVIVELHLERPIGKGKDRSRDVLTSRSSGWVRDFAGSTTHHPGFQARRLQCDITSKDGKKSELFDIRIVSREEDDAVKEDLKKLQGKWTVKAIIYDGKEVETIRKKGSTWTIKDNKITYGEDYPGYDVIQLDASKTPRAMVIKGVRKEKDKEGKEKEVARPTKCIYKIEGETLTLCQDFGGKDFSAQVYPPSFESKVGSGFRLMTLTRAKQ